MAKTKQYFTDSVDEAITLYNKTDNMAERNRIYGELIHIPMSKLVEIIYNKFKFQYIEVDARSMKDDCLAHCVANLKNFDITKGKAFSYFSISARNFFILINNRNFKRFNLHISHQELFDSSGIEVEDTRRTGIQGETTQKICDFWKRHNESPLTFFRKKKHQDLILSMCNILENDKLDIIEKRGVMNELRNRLIATTGYTIAPATLRTLVIRMTKIMKINGITIPR